MNGASLLYLNRVRGDNQADAEPKQLFNGQCEWTMHANARTCSARDARELTADSTLCQLIRAAALARRLKPLTRVPVSAGVGGRSFYKLPTASPAVREQSKPARLPRLASTNNRPGGSQSRGPPRLLRASRLDV